MSQTLTLGIGRQIITPQVGGNLSGYRPDIISESVHDDLTATAFCFRQGDLTVLMISVTVSSIRPALSDIIRERIEDECGIPKQHCLLHAIHTHSGPIINPSNGWGMPDPEYVDDVFIPRIVEAAREALSQAIPVTMKVSTGESLVGINRRELRRDNRIVLGQNPWGPFDPKMTVLSFAGEDGAPVANLIHYGCHGTAAGQNHEISRDWAGVMIDAVERVYGGITAYFNGPEGDVGPRLANGKTTGRNHVSDAVEHGGIAAVDALRICRQRNGYTVPTLELSVQTLNIPLGPRVPKEEAAELLKEFEGCTVNLKAKKRSYYERVLKSYESDYQEQDAIPIEQTILRLGDVAFVATPYELFSEIGMRIAQASPFPHTLTLSITNGSRGYFVTEDQICRGGYEVDMFLTTNIQPYVPNADFHFFTQTVTHLEAMKGE